MSDKQQSAVEYLHSEYKRIFGDNFVNPQQVMEMSDSLAKAKELFKQQSEFMFECGRNYQMTAEGTFNEVYNETFKTESK